MHAVPHTLYQRPQRWGKVMWLIYHQMLKAQADTGDTYAGDELLGIIHAWSDALADRARGGDWAAQETLKSILKEEATFGVQAIQINQARWN